jgi:hypothetical protein
MAYRLFVLLEGRRINLISPIRMAKANYSGEFHQWLIYAELRISPYAFNRQLPGSGASGIKD